MGQRKEGLDTALILLEILKRIPKHRKITAAELHRQLAAEGFDRDIRTVQRHLDTLAERFELERDARSKPYGYSWLARAQGIALPSLTPQESLLLKLAHAQLHALLPPKLMRSMEGFFEQASRNLGPDSNARLERQWLRKVRVVSTSQPLLAPEIKPSVFESVSEALFDNRYLDVDYANAAGWKQRARVMPLGLAQQGPRMYLVCRFDGYDDERSLALHRIQSASITTLSFDYPKDFDLARYDAEGGFGFGSAEEIQLRFSIDKTAGFHLTETPLSKDQTMIEKEGHYVVTATVVNSSMLDWWLRGFGGDVWGVSKRRRRLPRQGSSQAIAQAKHAH
ncbi:MAG: WYL domain-containing protein [Proteobacteria bacterium]|nr:WYL domain-containing protein [Pseudomonadota bacterium]